MVAAPDPLGKRALFSQADTTPRRAGLAGRALGHQVRRRTDRRHHRTGFLAGLHVATDRALAGVPRLPLGDLTGVVDIVCGACGQRSSVDVLQSLLLRLPITFALPGRGYRHFMLCPACHRRTWTSVSWKPRSR